MKIHDITHLIRPGMAVWPGDTAYSRSMTTRLADGALSDASTVTMSLHTGTHLDAPGHYLQGGATIDRLDLSLFLGPAEVITVTPGRGVIEAQDLRAALARRPQRLLVRANPATELDLFPEAFAAFSVEAAQTVVEAGVVLLGTDAPSVDALEGTSLPVHETLGRHGLVILENLRLADVPDGCYELVALPLKFSGADGSPVRAVLVEED